MKTIARVLAIRHLNFTNDQGQPIKGHHVYAAAQTGEAGWIQGNELLKIWVPDGSAQESLVAAMLPNDEVCVDFNRRGKPMLVDVV